MGGLAEQALLVQAAFSGDHQIGALQAFFKLSEFKHDVDTRPRSAFSAAMAM